MAGRLDRQLRRKLRQAERRALGNPDLSDDDRQAKFGLVGAALEATQEEQTLGNYKGKVFVSQLGKSCSPWESEGSQHATHKACDVLQYKTGGVWKKQVEHSSYYRMNLTNSTSINGSDGLNLLVN